MVELGGGESLSLVEADLVAAKWGASVVLVAGEHDVGKTTLLAEIYGQFLKGEFGGWAFAGSDCLMALDRRYDGTRGAGFVPPAIDHTVDEDMRLLDLRLWRRDDRRVSLLLSDIQGEFVRQVIEGASVEEELPIANRADRVIVVIDGSKIADHDTREEAITRAQILIGALTEPNGVRSGRPIAILLTKDDELDHGNREWFMSRVEQLRVFAESRHRPATIFITAARPTDQPHKPQGLIDLLAWLVEAPKGDSGTINFRVPADSRSFWRFRQDDVK